MVHHLPNGFIQTGPPAWNAWVKCLEGGLILSGTSDPRQAYLSHVPQSLDVSQENYYYTSSAFFGMVSWL